MLPHRGFKLFLTVSSITSANADGLHQTSQSICHESNTPLNKGISRRHIKKGSIYSAQGSHKFTHNWSDHYGIFIANKSENLLKACYAHYAVSTSVNYTWETGLPLYQRLVTCPSDRWIQRWKIIWWWWWKRFIPPAHPPQIIIMVFAPQSKQ